MKWKQQFEFEWALARMMGQKSRFLFFFQWLYGELRYYQWPQLQCRMYGHSYREEDSWLDEECNCVHLFCTRCLTETEVRRTDVHLSD